MSRRNDGIILSQRAYALKILEDSGMLEANATDTPMEARAVFRQTSKRDEEDSKKMINSTEYRSLIGKVHGETIHESYGCFEEDFEVYSRYR